MSGGLPRNIDAALMMAMTWEPTEADRMESIMMVPTEPIEVQDMRYEFNLPPKELCGPIPDLSGTYKAEATMTIAARDRQSFEEFLQGVRQTMTPPQTKPRSKRGQRRKRWR